MVAVCLPSRLQKLSIGSSAFSCVSGISYVKEMDVLLVALFDGSLHSIHNMSTEPSWVPTSSDDQLTSEALSQASHVFFAQTTSAGIEYVDVNRISGLVCHDSHSTLTWIYESLRPSDFSYKHEAKHECVLLTAPFWPLKSDAILRAAQDTLVQFDCGNYALDILSPVTLILMSYAATRSTPLHQLRPLFLHLCNTGRFAETCPRVLDILDHSPQDESLAVSVPLSSQGVGVELQRQLRESLATHLFGWNTLLSLRMRLSIADMCWVGGVSTTISHLIMSVTVAETVQGRAIAPALWTSCPPSADQHLPPGATHSGSPFHSPCHSTYS
ncbi:hypothetical protein J3R82DRAFT_2244 [Butyriboletus roseoflavus]|nr:hypothetical protein J3R82DRAFT_2244 [Butyriboletus roseoflavus]